MLQPKWKSGGWAKPEKPCTHSVFWHQNWGGLTILYPYGEQVHPLHAATVGGRGERECSIWTSLRFCLLSLLRQIYISPTLWSGYKRLWPTLCYIGCAFYVFIKSAYFRYRKKSNRWIKKAFSKGKKEGSTQKIKPHEILDTTFLTQQQQYANKSVRLWSRPSRSGL